MTRKGDINYVEAFSLVVIFIILLFIAPLSSAEEDSSSLMKLLSQYEDPMMTVRDLAFFLITHNFDAYPKEYYVEVHIEDTIYRLVPNGNQPGLASLNESHGLN